MKEKVIEKTIEWAKVITLAICMGIIVTYFIVPTVVSGESMYPTLNTKDYLIINKLAYKTDLKSRDGEKKSLVKRIIGLPNDHLVIKSGQVYINDKLIDEPYLEDTYTAGDIDIKIPSDSYFAMGDNRLVSKDSRDSDVGVVNKNEIVGEVSMRLFPFKEVGTIG